MATQEIDALQRWLVHATGLSSLRLVDAPPTLARPVVLWELPSSSRVEGMRNRFTAPRRKRAFGRLLIANYDQYADYSDRMMAWIEGANGLIPVFDKEGLEGVQIGWLKNAEIDFTESSDLNPQFVITYDVSYARQRNILPNASLVSTRVVIPEREG